MKTRLFYLWPLALLFNAACHKAGTDNSDLLDPTQVFIQEARAHFTLDTGEMSPLWDQASVQVFSFGKGVVIPVRVSAPLTIRVGPNQHPMTSSQVTWLLMYKDPALTWQVEAVLRIPSLDTTGPFVGKVRVQDWQGNFLRGFLYTGTTTLSLAESSTFRKTVPPSEGPILISPLFLSPTAPKVSTCTETDWYACTSVGGGSSTCEYEYTTEECTANPGSAQPPGSSPVTPTAADYLTVGGGGAGLPPASAGRIIASIKPDTSITNHPIVQCVYAHLMNPNLAFGLKNILSSFDDNQVYNITFALSTGISSDGMTTYLGNNNFRVLLNAGEAEDSDYSRIYLASTFIHEAFHAKLRQRALEVFGTVPISQWPIPIDDMTLSQLASYFESESKSYNIWESVEHDWMVDNIADLATSLRDFVQTYYKSTYASVGSGITPYEALMYMGLEGSTLFQEEVVGTGKASQFQVYWRDLNEGGKCQN